MRACSENGIKTNILKVLSKYPTKILYTIKKTQKNTMQVLVTGANGFIGRALCTRLLVEGWHVRGSVKSKKHLATLPAEVETVQVESIGLDTDWSRALPGIDVIVHLAARAHVMNNNVGDPLAAFREVNVDGTKSLAKMAANAGVKCFVFISSVKVNGEGKAIPYSEKDKPAPIEPYAVSKREAEQALNEIAEETGLEVVVLRSPLVYGPDVKANFLRLLKLVEKGVPLPLASIYNRRSLIYLGNLIDAIVAGIKHPKAAGQTYLVSDGEDIATPDLVRQIADAMGRPSRLFPVPVPILRFAGKIFGKIDSIERLIGSLTVNSSKIRRELDWRPPFTMEQGLRETAKWYLSSEITK